MSGLAQFFPCGPSCFFRLFGNCVSGSTYLAGGRISIPLAFRRRFARTNTGRECQSGSDRDHKEPSEDLHM